MVKTLTLKCSDGEEGVVTLIMGSSVVSLTIIE
jgi:hypothetical protein